MVSLEGGYEFNLILFEFLLIQWFSMEGDFPPKRCLAMSGDIFAFCDLGGGGTAGV